MQHPFTVATAPARLITCIVPAGEGFALAESLHEEMALSTVDLTHGRGASQRSGTFADEMDVLTVVVAAERADAVFAFVYERARIASMPNRFMFQMALEAASPYQLPAVP
ncbi:MAG: hypothetical protein RLW61_20300 [Gammaproteobacteria bacterium]